MINSNLINLIIIVFNKNKINKSKIMNNLNNY